VWSVNGVDTSLSTTFVSSSKLTAVIPAALMASPATADVLVETGDPVGSLPLSKSNSVGFIVTATSGSISISSVSPTSAIAGSPDLTITVSGSNFFNLSHSKSFVFWSLNGVETLLSTNYVSSSELRAVIPAALMASPTTANVLVETGDPIGSSPFAKSNSISFVVNP
jgi:Ca2+/H+ antiporter